MPKYADPAVFPVTAPAATDNVMTRTAAGTDGNFALGNLAGLAPLAIANDQAPFFSGGAWGAYSLTAAGRALSGVAGTANTFPYFSAANVVTLASVGTTGLASLAAANQAAGRNAIQAAGVVGDEAIAGNKTYTGTSTFTGAVVGAVQMDTHGINHTVDNWIKIANMPWPGPSVSALALTASSGNLTNTRFGVDTINVSAKGYDASTVLSQAVVDNMVSHIRSVDGTILLPISIGVTLSMSGGVSTGIDVWIRSPAYTRGMYILPMIVSNAVYNGRSIPANTVSTAPAGILYATPKVKPETTSSSYRPVVSNVQSLGESSRLWTQVFATNPTISTSDARLKTDPRQLRDAEFKAASAIARLPAVWRWLSRVHGDENCEPEGKEARKHFGPTVQAAIAVMEANGLDPFAHSFICYDEWEALPEQWHEWEAQEAVLDDDGNVVTPAVEAGRELVQEAREAGDRYSFRKEELLCFIVRALAQEIDGLSARVAALEAGRNP
ncbi:tail fiber domain-containing protein [Stenotrophomonas sp. AS1]|uniref:tail fiber domain-containing protein n=1 Tax=Stenotrophomonas sp. AS1 TaxID=3029188 RepID=UPI003B7CFCAE